ncbi:MAG: GNAT family N-acetyltransferase [Winogradskyella sp.]|uniref:GNAT family N-acetyltransferase n=1 Tax=Winogradskyella sp. TaxID=1883156 RepID=UPI0018066252|nr:GNAT family N-acetyltransferase [Winogradskyella sp.]MBT8245545.1 GNAT family N-acetyltransferase [Winogradskyella sp.]NNK23930.1 GNAT family N-acetyltransferase [Winogradskyella sp.]
MIKLVRTTSENKGFIVLVKQLDAYLKITDGDEHEFYSQFNGMEALKNVVVAYDRETAIGCGAFKPFDENSVEIKRMFVLPEKRVAGVGNLVLNDLEDWAKLIGYSSCVLETGKRQIEAVKFYKKCGYFKIPKYEQYKGMENSICYKKELI